MPGVKIPQINRCMIAGRIVFDPELKTLPGGTTLCNLRLVNTEYWKDKSGEKQENSNWIDVVCWTGLAKFAAQALRKGSPVIVEGAWKTNEWEDKETGKKRQKSILSCTSIHPLFWNTDAPNGSNDDNDTPSSRQQTVPPPVQESEDIPF